MGKKFNIRNTYVFHDYYSRLKNIALSVFKWENLPDTCNARFLEECLYNYGHAIFVEDAEMSFLNLKVAPSDIMNVYEEPTKYTAFSIGYNKEYNADECVYIRNNYLRKSTDSTIILFAERLAVIERALLVNINAQKTPILIRCDDKTEKTLRTLYEQYEGDTPVIYGHKGLQEKPLECVVTGAPFVSDKLREEKRSVWNEALEFLGINTNPADKKKERLITTEVESNNEQIDIQTLTMKLCREDAAEKMSKMCGKDVKVTMRVDELKNLWDWGVKLHGEVPMGHIMEEVK